MKSIVFSAKSLVIQNNSGPASHEQHRARYNIVGTSRVSVKGKAKAESCEAVQGEVATRSSRTGQTQPQQRSQKSPGPSAKQAHHQRGTDPEKQRPSRKWMLHSPVRVLAQNVKQKN